MRILMMSAVALAVAVMPAYANADNHHTYQLTGSGDYEVGKVEREFRKKFAETRQECRKKHYEADSRSKRSEAQRECRKKLAEFEREYELKLSEARDKDFEEYRKIRYD